MSDLVIQAQRDMEVVFHLWPSLPDEWAMQAIMFHLQQAVEKLLKFLCMNYLGQYPRTHDIRELMNMLNGKTELPEDLELIADSLTLWAVKVRYNSNTLASLRLLTSAKEVAVQLNKSVLDIVYEPQPETEQNSDNPDKAASVSQNNPEDPNG